MIEDNSMKGGKTFTQEDVNRIVQERLAREKEKPADGNLEAREKDLSRREARLSCVEYVTEKGYDKDLVDLLDVSDFEKFKEKADTLAAKMNVSRGTGSAGNFRRTHDLYEETEENKIRKGMGLKPR